MDKDALRKLTAAELRELLTGRRSAANLFATTVAGANAERDRSLAGIKRDMALAETRFGRQRDQGMRELGGRGLASQPMFAGRFLGDLREDEMNAIGALQADRARVKGQTKQTVQSAKERREQMLADLAAMEAAFRGGDIDSLLGEAGAY